MPDAGGGQLIIIIIIDNFCIALFSGVPKLTALYILQHFLSFTNVDLERPANNPQTRSSLCWSDDLCCFKSTETIKTIRDGEPGTATSPDITEVLVRCCFMSTETIKTIRDGEPRTATSTSAQLLAPVV